MELTYNEIATLIFKRPYIAVVQNNDQHYINFYFSNFYGLYATEIAYILEYFRKKGAVFTHGIAIKS